MISICIYDYAGTCFDLWCCRYYSPVTPPNFPIDNYLNLSRRCLLLFKSYVEGSQLFCERGDLTKRLLKQRDGRGKEERVWVSREAMRECRRKWSSASSFFLLVVVSQDACVRQNICWPGESPWVWRALIGQWPARPEAQNRLTKRSVVRSTQHNTVNS